MRIPKWTQRRGWRWERCFWSLTLLCVCSGCPNPSESFEEKIPSRWIRIASAGESQTAVLGWDDVERLKATIPTIIQMVTERQATVAMEYEGRTREIDLCATSPGMLRLASDVAGTTVAEGRFLSMEDSGKDPSVIVITHPVAEALFAGASPIGKTVSVGGKQVVVIGTVIAGDHLEIRDLGHDAYVPMTFTTVNSPNASNMSPPAADTKIQCIWVSVGTLDEVAVTREVIAATLEKHHEGVEFRVD